MLFEIILRRIFRILKIVVNNSNKSLSYTLIKKNEYFIKKI